MRIAVFGGTGRTGRLIVAQAIEAGHQVRALARSPQALDDLGDERLTVVAGDVRDPTAVQSTLDDSEAVIGALGPTEGSGDDLMSTAAGRIVGAMSSRGLRRLVWLTGAGVRDEDDRPKLVDRVFVAALKLLQRRLLEDSVAAVEEIRASDLDWTVVRAPRLVDEPGGADLYVGHVGGDSGTRVARADVATFMLAEAVEPTRVRAMPVVSAR